MVELGCRWQEGTVSVGQGAQEVDCKPLERNVERVPQKVSSGARFVSLLER
jgi:hypothetical protein